MNALQNSKSPFLDANSEYGTISRRKLHSECYENSSEMLPKRSESQTLLETVSLQEGSLKSRNVLQEVSEISKLIKPLTNGHQYCSPVDDRERFSRDCKILSNRHSAEVANMVCEMPDEDLKVKSSSCAQLPPFCYCPKTLPQDINENHDKSQLSSSVHLDWIDGEHSDCKGFSLCDISNKSDDPSEIGVPLDKHSYENWSVATCSDYVSSSLSISSSSDADYKCETGDTKNIKSRPPLKSVILEFDPLYSETHETCSRDDDIEFLTSLISSSGISSTSGSSTNTDKESSNSVTPSVCSIMRSNSLVSVDSECNSWVENQAVDETSDIFYKLKRKASRLRRSNTSLSKWYNVKRVIKAVSDVRGVHHHNSTPKSKSTETAGGALEKPKISSVLGAALHNGFLFYSPSSGEKLRDFVQRWCQLSEGKLYYSADRMSAKDHIDLNCVTSVRIIRDHKISNDGVDVYCFEIATLVRSKPFVLGASCTTERRVWMQKILENMTPVFPVKFSADYTKAGWCFIKEGISGEWTPAWLLLQQRTVIYAFQDSKSSPIQLDLRKARFVGMQDIEDPPLSNLKPVILLDMIEQTYYLVMGKLTETTEWQRIVKAAAVDNGIRLVDQQLTKDDVPVIVDKCVNFIYAHGSMSEGIYRRSGSNSNVTKLLSLFRQDAWAVLLSRQEYTEYDVSNVLKRFFRDLPEPLLTSQLHKHLCNAPGVKCSEEEKLLLYRNVLKQLPSVSYVTVKKLIGHLHFIHELRERNLMPVENLAAVWGPTLMHVEDTVTVQWSKRESEAISDLILLFPKLFIIDTSERERENRMRKVLENYYDTVTQSPLLVKPSGDLKVWVYLNSKDSGQCINITVNPNKECGAVCNELSDKMDVPAHLLCLHEFVCDGTLTRPIHHTERVLDVVLRWSYWDEADRKDNYLVLTKSSIIQEIFPLIKVPLSVSGELKFADEKSRTFKNYLFEFSQSKLSYYKDKKGSVKGKEWKIEDILWYLGHESKRNPHSRWSITFIEKSEKLNRSKDKPFFGCTIAGSSKEEELRWVAALLAGQYAPADLLPPVTLLQ